MADRRALGPPLALREADAGSRVRKAEHHGCRFRLEPAAAVDHITDAIIAFAGISLVPVVPQELDVGAVECERTGQVAARFIAQPQRRAELVEWGDARGRRADEIRRVRADALLVGRGRRLPLTVEAASPGEPRVRILIQLRSERAEPQQLRHGARAALLDELQLQWFLLHLHEKKKCEKRRELISHSLAFSAAILTVAGKGLGELLSRCQRRDVHGGRSSGPRCAPSP